MNKDCIIKTPPSKRKDIFDCLWQRDYPPDMEPGPGSIDYHDLREVARRLRNADSIDENFRFRLADKLDPSDPKKSRYKLKLSSGRPRKPSLEAIQDRVLLALDRGDLKIIADHLRENPSPHPRILNWLADRLHPATTDGPHFIVKLPRGKPGERSPWRESFRRLEARQIDIELRQYGKLEAALQMSMQKTGKSRSTARREWLKHRK